MNEQPKRWLLIITGWICLLLGVAGLFLPILQGVLFIVIGLAILSSEYVWAHRLLHKLRNRFPRVSGKADEGIKRVTAWIQRLPGQRQ
jgi:uncharacterized membrane protein YbaN (DUF454 family)